MEIDSLVDVHDWVRMRMKTEDIMIAGDLNAGGQFIRQSDWSKCRLRQAGYTWLIPDHVDTTASNTLAAYDRLGQIITFKIALVGSLEPLYLDTLDSTVQTKKFIWTSTKKSFAI